MKQQHITNISAKTLQLHFKNAISKCKFSENWKLADVTAVFNIKDLSDKTNHRSVSVLPPVSNIFWKVNNA